MPSSRFLFRQRWQVPFLYLLIALALIAGIGMREPMPADEPRFVLFAQGMVETGQWLFPYRGTEIYAEKPPTFMWMQAASFLLTQHWPIAFLLPSLLAAFATLWLTGDLARRLWGSWAKPYAIFGLFVCLQFALQAKRAQIDMVLVATTTLSLWALMRYLLERGNPWLLALGAFSAGVGTVTKGVGFLPLLIFIPWLWIRFASPFPRPALRGWHVGIGFIGFVVGAGVWLIPMLTVALTSTDPVLHSYARELLFKQTGTRYANAWHHIKPAWYYLQSMMTLWLPGVLLAPWLLPAWCRRIRRADPRITLPVIWALLVLLFFSASPGKREVYILPMLPAVCLAAAPLLPALLAKRGVVRMLWVYLFSLASTTALLAIWLWVAPEARLLSLIEGRGMSLEALSQLAYWLVAFSIGAFLILGVSWMRHKKQPTLAVIVVSALLWITYGIGFMPILSPDSSAQNVMQRASKHLGPKDELALLAWSEQHMLQADRPVHDFGFKQSWSTQWQRAKPWLQAAPTSRWLFVRKDAVPECLEWSSVVALGQANRRDWLLIPGHALPSDCTFEQSSMPNND